MRTQLGDEQASAFDGATGGGGDDDDDGDGDDEDDDDGGGGEDDDDGGGGEDDDDGDDGVSTKGVVPKGLVQGALKGYADRVYWNFI